MNDFKYFAIMKMKIVPENADTADEGKLEATLEANRIINEINRESDYPDIELIEVKDVTPRFSLRNTSEARELIDNHICHESCGLMNSEICNTCEGNNYAL